MEIVDFDRCKIGTNDTKDGYLDNYFLMGFNVSIELQLVLLQEMKYKLQIYEDGTLLHNSDCSSKTEASQKAIRLIEAYTKVKPC